MALEPLNDTVFGDVIEHETSNELLSELASLTAAFDGGRSYEMEAGRRQLEAQLAPQKQPYQIKVTAIGPDVRGVSVGDVALLPEGGGTMVTIVDEETGVFRRIFMISERAILACFSED